MFHNQLLVSNPESSWNRLWQWWFDAPVLLRSISRPTVVLIAAACRAISSVCWWEMHWQLRSQADRCWTARGMGGSTGNWEWRQAREQNSTKSWYIALHLYMVRTRLGRQACFWYQPQVESKMITKPPCCSTWVSQMLRRQKTDMNLWCPHDSVVGVWASEIDNDVAQK